METNNFEKQFNIKCAKFLGWKETTEEFKINWVGCKSKERLEKLNQDYIPIFEKNGNLIFNCFSTFNFYNDWRLIIEVIENIEKLDFSKSGYSWESDNEKYYNNEGTRVSIEYNECTIYENLALDPIHIYAHVKGKNKHDATTKAIDQFLTWYNSKHHDK